MVLNARDAADRGARIMTRTAVVSARRDGGLWEVDVAGCARPASVDDIRRGMLVNAAGPWVDRCCGTRSARTRRSNVRLVQGSHIVVRKKFDDPRAYFFQNPDGRIIFAIPYEDDFTLIGTTDRDYNGDPADVRITEAEIDYLCARGQRIFRRAGDAAAISSGPIPASGRSTTTAPRRRRRRRATTC